MDLTHKQIGKLMKGVPVQLSHSTLQTMHPDIMSSFGQPLVKKIQRAIREGRGVRLHLKEDERETLGGKIDWKKIGKQAKTVAKFVARPLISGATSALTTGALTALGQPELAPVLAPLASTAVNKALDYGHLGIGLKDALKQKAWLKSPRQSGDLLTKVLLKGVAGTGKKRGRPLKKVADKIHIDIQSHNDESDSETMEGGALKLGDVKKMLISHFTPHVQGVKEARQLTNLMLKHGADVLDSHPLGGSLSSSLKKGAKKLYQYAKPLLKHFGEEAIKQGKAYAKPALEEALGAVASQYGIDPSVVKFGTDAMLDVGEKLAKEQLTKHTTPHASQTPEVFMGRMQQDALDTLQNRASTMSPSSTEKSSHLSHEYHHSPVSASHSSLMPDVYGVEDSSLLGFGTRRKKVLRHRVHDPIDSHMGTLLSHTNPAMTPFKPPPNLPQGQISGGSFRAYGDSTRYKYGGSFMM